MATWNISDGSEEFDICDDFPDLTQSYSLNQSIIVLTKITEDLKRVHQNRKCSDDQTFEQNFVRKFICRTCPKVLSCESLKLIENSRAQRNAT